MAFRGSKKLYEALRTAKSSAWEKGFAETSSLGSAKSGWASTTAQNWIVGMHELRTPFQDAKFWYSTSALELSI